MQLIMENQSTYTIKNKPKTNPGDQRWQKETPNEQEDCKDNPLKTMCSDTMRKFKNIAMIDPWAGKRIDSVMRVEEKNLIYVIVTETKYRKKYIYKLQPCN